MNKQQMTQWIGAGTMVALIVGLGFLLSGGGQRATTAESLQPVEIVELTQEEMADVSVEEEVDKEVDKEKEDEDENERDRLFGGLFGGGEDEESDDMDEDEESDDMDEDEEPDDMDEDDD